MKKTLKEWLLVILVIGSLIIIGCATSCTKIAEDPGPTISVDTTQMQRHYSVGDTIHVDASKSMFHPGHPFGSMDITKTNYPQETITFNSLIGYWIFTSPGNYNFDIQIFEKESERRWNDMYQYKTVVQ